MTDYVIVANEATSLQKRRVVLYLENAQLEHRATIFRVDADTDVDVFVQANFNALWAGASDINDSQWEDEADRDDVRDKVAAVLQQIGDDLAILDGSPTNAQVLGVLRRTLLIVRKVVRYVSD